MRIKGKIDEGGSAPANSQGKQIMAGEMGASRLLAESENESETYAENKSIPAVR